MKRRHFLQMTATLAGLTLSGCGFQLRGRQANQTLKAIQVEGNRSSTLYRALERRLVADQAKHATSSEPPAWQLSLGADKFETRQIGSRMSNEYRLSLSVPITVQERGSGKIALDSTSISVSTSTHMDDNALLNRDIIEDNARHQLTRQLAERIVERLRLIDALMQRDLS